MFNGKQADHLVNSVDPIQLKQTNLCMPNALHHELIAIIANILFKLKRHLDKLAKLNFDQEVWQRVLLPKYSQHMNMWF